MEAVLLIVLERDSSCARELFPVSQALAAKAADVCSRVTCHSVSDVAVLLDSPRWACSKDLVALHVTHTPFLQLAPSAAASRPGALSAPPVPGTAAKRPLTVWVKTTAGVPAEEFTGLITLALTRPSCLQQLQQLSLRALALGPETAINLGSFAQRLTNLQYLDLHGNNIGSEGAAAVAAAAQRWPRLRHLDLGSNQIGRKGAEALASAWEHLAQLQHLNLSNNKIAPHGIVALLQAVKRWPQLQPLGLAEHGSRLEGSVFVERCNHLQHLDLSHNHLGAQGVAAVAAAAGALPQLQHLCLARVTLTIGDAVQALAPAMQYWGSLRHLDLSDSLLHVASIAALLQGAQHCTQLSHLGFGSTFIGLDASNAGVLAEALQYLPELQHLDLNVAGLADAGAAAVAAGAQYCTRLRYLALNCNRIRPDGAANIALAAPYWRHLQYLDLSTNSIGPTGAAAIASAAPCWLQLQELHLGHNSIGCRGACALAAAAQHMPHLQRLDLSRNRIGIQGAAALSRAMRHWTRLQHLDVRRNDIKHMSFLVLSSAAPGAPMRAV